MRRQVLLLRGLAILAVVLNHATGWAFVAMFWWTHRYTATTVPDYSGMDSPAYWLLMAINQAALFSVPAFLVISGLSAAYSVGSGSLADDWRVVRARLGSLMGPYLIWSLLAFAIDAALGTVLSPREYGARLLKGEVVEAYYFVPLLIQFYLLSPFIVRGIRSRPGVMLAAAASLQAATVVGRYIAAAGDVPAVVRSIARLPAWSVVQWPLYYVLGAALGLHSRRALRLLERYRTVLLVSAATLAALSLAESQFLWRLTGDWDWAHSPWRWSSTLYSLAFVLLAMTWRITATPLTRTIEGAGALSYGIYLMHPKALELGARAIYHLAPGVLARQVTFAALLFALPLAGCWLAMALVARSPARRLYHIVFG